MSRAIPISFPRSSLLRQAPGRQSTPPSMRSVREQLARILASESFICAKRMRRFLTFVVEETLAGRAAQVCEYSIGVSVFERNEPFDPALDPIVRNDARRLRQKLFEYYQRSGPGADRVIIEIPKGGYVPVFRAASARASGKDDSQYRLVATLIRVSDGAQVWTTEQLLSGY